MDGGGCCCGSCFVLRFFSCANRTTSVVIPLVAQVGDDNAERRASGRVAILATMMMVLCLPCSSSSAFSRRQFSLFRCVQGGRASGTGGTVIAAVPARPRPCPPVVCGRGRPRRPTFGTRQKVQQSWPPGTTSCTAAVVVGVVVVVASSSGRRRLPV